MQKSQHSIIWQSLRLLSFPSITNSPRSMLLPTLQKLVKFGSPKQAKHAISCMQNMSVERQVFQQLFQVGTPDTFARVSGHFRDFHYAPPPPPKSTLTTRPNLDLLYDYTTHLHHSFTPLIYAL